MDALILRVALLLALAPSAVCAMQATDVLVLAVADGRSREVAQTMRDLTAIQDASLINLAVFAPEKLSAEDAKVRERAGLTVPVPSGDADALFSALPIEDA